MADLTCGTGGSTGAEIVNQINTNTTDIASNVVEIQVNRDLASDNSTSIAINSDAILELQEVETFNFHSGVDLTPTEVYSTVTSLNIANLVAGTYMVGMSVTYQLDVTNKSAFTQLTVNSGTPEEFSKEPKDNTDREAFMYMFPMVHAADGPFTLDLSMRREDATGTLSVHYANSWVERKV